MPIIRRKLDPNTVYPETLRYDEATDTVQSLINGDWVDNPDADPRNQTLFPGRITSNTQCDAAESVKDALKAQIDATIEAIANASTAFTIAGIILSFLSFGVFAVLITLVLTIADAMIGAGASALEAALTDPVYHQLVCILVCLFDSNGRLKPGGLDQAMSDVNGQIGGLAATTINAMLSLAGEGGINNLAAIGTSTGDCSDCDDCCTSLCPAATQGFEYGDNIETTENFLNCTTTFTGDSIDVAGTHSVRWGFYADSNTEGCFSGGATFSAGIQDWYYRFVGEASSTQHGPVSHEDFLAAIDGECVNLIQVNSNASGTFSFIFLNC